MISVVLFIFAPMLLALVAYHSSGWPNVAVSEIDLDRDTLLDGHIDNGS